MWPGLALNTEIFIIVSFFEKRDIHSSLTMNAPFIALISDKIFQKFRRSPRLSFHKDLRQTVLLAWNAHLSPMS